MADNSNEYSLLGEPLYPDSTTNDEQRISEENQDLDKSAAKPNKTEGDENSRDGLQSPDSNKNGDKSMGGDENEAHEMEEQDNMDVDNDKKKDAEDSDLDDSDDNINIIIGNIKTSFSGDVKQLPNMPMLIAGTSQEKIKQSPGKFNIDEFESVEKIKSVPAQEFSIDSLEEKPWRKPGADITDYFNYGFNEDTWRSYCERQKRIRLNDSRVGLQGLTQIINVANSKFSGSPNSARRSGQMSAIPPKENVIQVMTAECREYSKIERNEYFEPDGNRYGSEPTQDSQWTIETANWSPSQMQEWTPGPEMDPLSIGMHPAMAVGPPMGVPLPPHNDGMAMMSPMIIPPEMGRYRDYETKQCDRGCDQREERYKERDINRDHERVRERDWYTEREWKERRGKPEVERNSGPSEFSRREWVNGRKRRRDYDRERSTRWECTRSREKSGRRTRSQERERIIHDRKKSHRKDKKDTK